MKKYKFESEAELAEKIVSQLKQDGKVLACLQETWKTFLKLQEDYPSDTLEFNQAIQHCSIILQCRIFRRNHSEDLLTARLKRVIDSRYITQTSLQELSKGVIKDA